MSSDSGRVCIGSLLFAGFVALTFSVTLRAKDLDGLVQDYEQARSKTGTKNWPRTVETRIAPILARIGKLKDPAALKMLRREYSGSDPYLVAAAGTALLGSGSKDGVEAVIRGFNKGNGWNTVVRVRILDELAATRLPAALDFLVKRARGGAKEIKVIAIRSLSRFPRSSKACEAVLDGLKSSHPLVRR